MKNGLAVLMLVFGLALHGHAANLSHTQDTAQVVFICEHGSAKSVIAAAYFNKIAQQRGLALRAVSRGISVDPALQPATQRGLNLDGVDTTGMTPTAITPEVAQAAVRVVTIGLDTVPDFLKTDTLREWNNIAPVSSGYAQSRDGMVKEITALMDQLVAGEK
jgi:protein-tyrosine-phosphatase